MSKVVPPTGTYRYNVQVFVDGELSIDVFRYKVTDPGRDFAKFNESKIKTRRCQKHWTGVVTTNDIAGYLKELIGEEL